MKPAGIEKDEIMMMLADINNKLEQLEADLDFSNDKVQKEWYVSQVNKLEACEKKLNVLERSMTVIEQNETEIRMNYSHKKIAGLELGF